MLRVHGMKTKFSERGNADRNRVGMKIDVADGWPEVLSEKRRQHALKTFQCNGIVQCLNVANERLGIIILGTWTKSFRCRATVVYALQKENF